jgi:uncharacterized protein YlzI (FlbEa/FlbD family)
MFIEIESEGVKKFINVDNVTYIEPRPTGSIIFFNTSHLSVKEKYENVVKKINEQVELSVLQIPLLQESVSQGNENVQPVNIDTNTLLNIVNQRKSPGRPRNT